MSGQAPARIALGIPARNAVSYLPRLLESAEAQTSPFEEILLYDDASTDATGDLARRAGARVVRADQNTGPSAGKNILARTSTCDWIHFHDADDALGSEFVARARAWLARDEFDVLLMGTEDRDDRTGAHMAERRWDAAALVRDSVAYCIVNNVTNCGVYRRLAFLEAGGFDTNDDTRFNEDQAMHLRLAIAGLRFRAEDYLGTIIYRRANSMSSGNGLACARAHYHVLAGVAAQTGGRYAAEIGAECWTAARILGTYRDWAYVRRALALARTMNYDDPVAENARFRWLARVHPLGAVMLREQVVRLLKPGLRTGI